MFLMGSYEASAQGVVNADYNLDGGIDFTDVTMLYMALIG